MVNTITIQEQDKYLDHERTPFGIPASIGARILQFNIYFAKISYFAEIIGEYLGIPLVRPRSVPEKNATRL
jgi:hypothetical protein